MLLSLRFILRHTVLKYIIVVVCALEQPTTWSLPIVLHITLGILEQFWWSKWPPKALKKTFSNNTKNVSKQSVFTKLSADQSVITKSPDTKLPISQEPLNVITKSWWLKDHLMWVFRKNLMEFSVGLDYLLILLLQVAVLY